MGIILMLIIGGIVGWLAARLMGRDEGVIASVVIGVVGALIGGFLSSLFTGTNQSYLGFSWVGIFWAFVGSVILVAILNAITHRTNVPKGI